MPHFHHSLNISERRPFWPPPFWTIIFLSLGGYGLLAAWFPLLPHVAKIPLPDIRTFTPSLALGLGYGLLLLALHGLYWLAYRWLQQQDTEVSLAAVAITAVCFGLPLLFVFPINATDVYRYVIRGRITSVYDANPFAVPATTFADDPFLPLAGQWADATSPYGPIWELTAAGVTAVSGDNLLLGLLLFKGLGLLLHVAIGIFIWRLLAEETPPRRVARTLLWLWNPALLLVFVVNGHNDAFMLFWLVLGLWVWRRGKRPFLGFTLMLLSPFTKPIGLLAIPIFFLAILRQQEQWRAQLRFMLLSAFTGLLMLWLTFLPFGSPLTLARRLLQEAAGGGFSLTALIILAARGLGVDLPFDAVLNIALWLFLMAVAGLLWLTWRGRSSLRGTADVFMGYLLQAFSFRIWYSSWLFPWLLLGDSRYRRRIGLWFLLTAQLSVLIYGHLRVYALGGDHTLAHFIGVPFTFGLPFLLAKIDLTGEQGDKTSSNDRTAYNQDYPISKL